ncbi:hypothetical protein [Nonomuraea dietziae]|uniref:hypothetical protein n=1 Tax=Nonomuraea dietziae TaxID=65515 RepID=UPI00342A28F0
MADLGLIDAWGMWLDGRSTLGHTLYGIPMVWVGRTGKIIAFLSAFAVLVDIVGPERLPDFASSFLFEPKRQFSEPPIAYVLAYGFLGMWGAVVAVVLRILHVPWDEPIPRPWGGPIFMIGLYTVLALLAVGPTCVSWLLRQPGFPTAVRIASLLSVILGFHFDLLAS